MRQEITHERVQDEPPVGAHLVTPRRGYTHHGIYAGAGRVIHYRGLAHGLRRGPVEEVSLACFAAGRAVRIHAHVAPRFDREEIVRRARSRLGENRYRLLTNNCEHLCEWCVQGCSRSSQVAGFSKVIRPLLRAAADVVAQLLVPMRAPADSRH
jgi:hypothetical protein